MIGICVEMAVIGGFYAWLYKKNKEICGDMTPEEKIQEMANELAEKKRKEWNESR